MKFRSPKCTCKPGAGQMRWQPSIQAWTCALCKVVDQTASPEDMSIFKKVRAMNEALITESLDNGKLLVLLQVLLNKLALSGELNTILMSSANKPASVEETQKAKKKTLKVKEETATTEVAEQKE